MESPSKYTGYNENGQVVTIRYGEDANNYINPTSVQLKINNVNEVMNEQLTLIQNALRDIITDANQALVVDNATITPQIEEAIEAIENIKDGPSRSMGDIYAQSVNVHDHIQGELNERARGIVINTPGVVRWN